MIERINATVERALREAMGHVAHAEADKIESALAVLNDEERTEALGLALLITCYVGVDICELKWPNDPSIRQIAEDLATTGTTAKRLHLNAEQIYAYLSRVVFGPERLEEVFPDEPTFTRLPVIVAQRASGVYRPDKEKGWWDYLDQIEAAIEGTSALNPVVLPAAVMRAYLTKPQARD